MNSGAASDGKMGRVVGLDPGERWLGVAICDDAGRLALPLTTIDRRAEADDGVERIRALLAPEGASRVVVGVPLRPDGEEDAQASAFRALGERVARGLGLPLEVQSERFSNPLAATPPSDKRRRPARRVAQQRRQRIEEHAQAAANILQRWLDALAGASR